jgi:hypothetical protein
MYHRNYPDQKFPVDGGQIALTRDNVFVFVGKYMSLIERKTNLIDKNNRFVENIYF